MKIGCVLCVRSTCGVKRLGKRIRRGNSKLWIGNIREVVEKETSRKKEVRAYQRYIDESVIPKK